MKRIWKIGVLIALSGTGMAVNAQRLPEAALPPNPLLALPKAESPLLRTSAPLSLPSSLAAGPLQTRAAADRASAVGEATSVRNAVQVPVEPKTHLRPVQPKAKPAHVKPSLAQTEPSADAKAAPEPKPAAALKSASPTPLFLETKADLPGTPPVDSALGIVGAKPRESSFSAINDGGRMVIYLFPLLLCVVGAIRLLARYQSRSGRLPAPLAALAVRAGETARPLPKPAKPLRPAGGFFAALAGGLKTENVTASGGGAIRLVESVPLGGANLHLIEVRGRSILVGATANGLNVLTEFGDAQQEEDTRFRYLLEEAATNLDGLDMSAVGDSPVLRVGSLEEELRDASASVERSAQRLQTLR